MTLLTVLSGGCIGFCLGFITPACQILWRQGLSAFTKSKGTGDVAIVLFIAGGEGVVVGAIGAVAGAVIGAFL